MNVTGIFSSATDKWETPQDLYDRLNQIFCFNLDACADETNHKCDRYFTEAQDGLSQSWGGYRVWCNPPYGRSIGAWVEKAADAVLDGQTSVVMLLPARTDTRWYHDFIAYNEHAHVHFIRGRLRFGGSNQNAPFPSMIVLFA